MAAFFTPLSIGIQELGKFGVYVLLAQSGVLTVLGTVWVLRLDSEPVQVLAGEVRPSDPEEDSAGRCPPHALLRTLSLDDLVTEWRTSAGRGHRASVSHRHAVVRWREALLDEMERRDPTDLHDWLPGGAAWMPEDHIRASSEKPATRADDSTR